MISIKSLSLGLTASLPLSLANKVFAQQRFDYVRWGMDLCMMGGMGDGMVQYDLYARLLGHGNSGPCLSPHTASPSHKE